jgi:hypothetical protein
MALCASQDHVVAVSLMITSHIPRTRHVTMLIAVGTEEPEWWCDVP